MSGTLRRVLRHCVLIMLLLTAWLAGGLGFGFTVDGFLPALLGAVVVSVVSAVLNVFVGRTDEERKAG